MLGVARVRGVRVEGSVQYVTLGKLALSTCWEREGVSGGSSANADVPRLKASGCAPLLKVVER